MQMTQRKAPPGSRPRVLVVDDEPAVAESLRDILGGSLSCRVWVAENLQRAREIIASQNLDLLVLDVGLPDGNGLALLQELHGTQPDADALVISGGERVDSAISAMRGGALDFVQKPFTAGQMADRVHSALIAQHNRRQQARRMLRLKSAVKRLNAARKLITRKVDLLCNDLIGAYGELSKNVDKVRLQQGFHQAINGADGLEQLLCHAMDWLLRQMGYCNIGIWLAAGDNNLQLGAYMKYTIPSDPQLVEAVQGNLLRAAARRGFVRLRGGDAKSHLTAAELHYLANQEIMAVSCTYLGETLGVIAMFRDQKTPFRDDDVTSLKTVAPMFSMSLAQAVHKGDGGDAEGPDANDAPKKKDPADWWKSGEDPPF